MSDSSILDTWPLEITTKTSPKLKKKKRLTRNNSLVSICFKDMSSSKKVQNILLTAIAVVIFYQILLLTYQSKKMKVDILRVQNEAARKDIELNSDIRRLRTELEDKFEWMKAKSKGINPLRAGEHKFADLSSLKTMRQLWQIVGSNFPDMDDFNSSKEGRERPIHEYSLSLNSYLTAWMYTMEIMTQASTALQQMIEPLNLSMCDLVAFALTGEYFNQNITTNTNSNQIIMKAESDLSKNFVSELGSTYRILDLISKIQKALANEQDKADPAALVFNAYKESSVSTRHSWVLRNTIKLAMKMSLPSLQSEFAFQLAGGIDSSEFSLNEIEINLVEIFKEFELAVKSMEEVHEYFFSALEGDHDDILNSKIPKTYDEKVIIDNSTSSFQAICRIEWLKIETNRNTKEDMVQQLSDFLSEKVVKRFEIGSYCRVSIC